MMTLVASALAGGDCIDDADVSRTQQAHIRGTYRIGYRGCYNRAETTHFSETYTGNATGVGGHGYVRPNQNRGL